MIRPPALLSLFCLLTLAGSLFGSAALAAENLLCSTFPVYLFTRNIVGDSGRYEVRLMIDSSQGCPHDYAPTPAELERLSQAGLLVINGRGLESFLSRSLTVAKADLKIIDASGGPEDEGAAIVIDRSEAARRLGVFAHDHNHDHDHGHDHHQDNDHNPHLFAAPSSAVIMIDNIEAGLTQLDPENAAAYKENAAKLRRELNALAELARRAGQTLGQPKVIVSHGIFDFLATDLGFEIAASIEEEDGAEPSAARLAELIKLARAEKVRAILTDPEGNINLARTLGAETRLPVAIIDPVAAGPPNAPPDYYQRVMLTNLDVLNKLLGPSPEQPQGAAKKKPD